MQSFFLRFIRKARIIAGRFTRDFIAISYHQDGQPKKVIIYKGIEREQVDVKEIEIDSNGKIIFEKKL